MVGAVSLVKDHHCVKYILVYKVNLEVCPYCEQAWHTSTGHTNSRNAIVNDTRYMMGAAGGGASQVNLWIIIY